MAHGEGNRVAMLVLCRTGSIDEVGRAGLTRRCRYMARFVAILKKVIFWQD